jgi:hypothetical protein
MSADPIPTSRGITRRALISARIKRLDNGSIATWCGAFSTKMISGR